MKSHDFWNTWKISGYRREGKEFLLQVEQKILSVLNVKLSNLFPSFLCLQSSWFWVPNLNIDFLLVITRHIFHASCRKLVVHQDSSIFSLFLLPVSITMLHYFGNTFSVNDSWSWIMRYYSVMTIYKHCLLLFSCSQNFLFKCIGVVLNKISNKDFVHTHLNIMFSSVKHSSQVEREVSNISLPLSFTI